MVADGPVPWYNVPPRPFPVHLWMQQRYGFGVPPLRLARQLAPGPRPFPARVWMAGGIEGWWLARVNRNTPALS